MKSNFFATKSGIICTGAIIGLLAVVLQYLGNPPNMGVCVACFSRDVAGSVGLHRAAVVQYLRPEIIGMVIGSFGASMMFGEFKARGGSALITRFTLGLIAGAVSLVFLGCPWRAILRIAGGDANALVGIAGLIVGIAVASQFLKKGFSLGRSQQEINSAGWAFPLLMVGLFVLLIMNPQIAGEPKSGVLFYSVKGPGAAHAPLFISLGIGLLVGFICQRSRFCTMGAFRDTVLFKQMHLLSGVLAMLVTALILNVAIGSFHAGFTGQPVAHNDGLWNFLSMVVCGLAFCLAGACPGRQLFLSGEGDNDAAVFVIGLLVGTAFAHNFGIAASPAGIGPNSIIATILGLGVCLGIAFFACKKGGSNVNN